MCGLHTFLPCVQLPSTVGTTAGACRFSASSPPAALDPRGARTCSCRCVSVPGQDRERGEVRFARARFLSSPGRADVLSWGGGGGGQRLNLFVGGDAHMHGDIGWPRQPSLMRDACGELCNARAVPPRMVRAARPAERVRVWGIMCLFPSEAVLRDRQERCASACTSAKTKAWRASCPGAKRRGTPWSCTMKH